MKTLNKILTTTALITGLNLTTGLNNNSYSQDLRNILVSYVSIREDKEYTYFDVDSIKKISTLSYRIKKPNFLDVFKEKNLEEDEYNLVKHYIIKKTEEKTLVIPSITVDGYDFSKDSKTKIEKEVKKFVNEGNLHISDPMKFGSTEMYFELAGEDKK